MEWYIKNIYSKINNKSKSYYFVTTKGIKIYISNIISILIYCNFLFLNISFTINVKFPFISTTNSNI